MNDIKSTVRLESISIEGYRSCKHTEFAPHPQLSALIGINGAGKTNVLSAIRSLAQFDSRRNRYFQNSVNHDTTNVPAPQLVSWFLLKTENEGRDRRVGLRVALITAGSGSSADEVVDTKEEWNFSELVPDDFRDTKWLLVPPFLQEGFEAGAQFGESIRRHRVNLGDREVAISLAASLPGSDTTALQKLIENKLALTAIKLINGWRRTITYYSASQFTDPSRCPTNFELTADRRLEYAYRGVSPHLQFLFDMYTLRANSKERYDEYEEFVSRKHLGLISRISWRDVKLSSHTAEVGSGGKFKKQKVHKTLVIPTVHIGHSHVSFSQVSEGTLRTLALMFYVMTTSSKCLLIEEPEVCIHHGLLTRIMDTIKSYSVTKQVIVSTHSDQVIDRMTPDNVFVVEHAAAGTKVKPLALWAGKKGTQALHSYLDESGTLGEYWRSGGLSS